MESKASPVLYGERESLTPIDDFYDELFRVLFAAVDRFTVRQIMACARALDVPVQVQANPGEIQDHLQRHVRAGKLHLGSSGGRIDYRRAAVSD